TRSMVLQSIAISPRTTTSAAPCCGYPRVDRLRGSGWGAPRARWPDTGRVVVLRRGHRDLPGSCRRTGDATTLRPQSTQEGIGSPDRLAVCSPSCIGLVHLL